MVLEDDVFLPDSIKDWIGPGVSELRQRCDILYLGYNRDAIASFGYGGGDWFNVAFERSPATFDDEARQHNRWSNKNTHCVVDIRLAWGIIAYLISPRGARLLLENCFPMSGKIPVQMYGAGRLLTPFSVDGIMNTVIQRGLIKARAVFPPLVIGPNERADSDNLAGSKGSG
jgi:hypothetical protein